MTPSLIDHPSPNHGDRRGARPDIVVLHYTAMADAPAALERLCDPAAEVSAHYLIGADGTAWRLVDEDRRAWHAGSGAWAGVNDVNSRSIGIELDNPGDAPFAAAQMTTLEVLLIDILRRQAIPPERVIGHACMAPERKTDPGPRFDWRRLALTGLAVWLDPPAATGRDDAAGDPEAFRMAARALGAPLDAGSGWTPRALAAAGAMAARFMPACAGRTGPPPAALVAHLAALAARWPAAAHCAAAPSAASSR